MTDRTQPARPARRRHLEELERLCVDVAVAGRAASSATSARRAWASPPRSRRDTDVVTVMDRRSEELLHRLIQQARPDDGILGEEGADVTGTSGLTWVVDPIDGTVNYLYEIPAYAVSVAVVVGDARSQGAWTPVAGAVADPCLRLVHHAGRGTGAWTSPEAGDGAAPSRLAVSAEDRLARTPARDRLRLRPGGARPPGRGAAAGPAPRPRHPPHRQRSPRPRPRRRRLRRRLRRDRAQRLGPRGGLARRRGGRRRRRRRGDGPVRPAQPSPSPPGPPSSSRCAPSSSRRGAPTDRHASRGHDDAPPGRAGWGVVVLEERTAYAARSRGGRRDGAQAAWNGSSSGTRMPFSVARRANDSSSPVCTCTR